ncbi:AMP-binding protein, partial [bacterium]|nr:AMP-binding protein [bacterium]
EDSSCPLMQTIENDLAYILYTSGSTGDPKGVMISHLNALTFVNWAFDCVRITPDDRVSNHAPLHFDLSVFDVFASIKGGATLCPVPYETAKFPVKLAKFIEGCEISVWYSVPSAWVHMVTRSQLSKFDLSKLRAIIFAGEVFPTKHLRALMQEIPGAEYYNWYGPTETNVITSYQVRNLPETNEPIPIGKACTNMDVFALDQDGKLVTEPGTLGELYGRGSGVAHGYWNDVGRTEPLFVRNPLQANFYERVYRTGDVVKLDEAGNYHYQGRSDYQVKVQGYRVELGEVEAAIITHSSVEEAAVLALQKEHQVTYLKAFIVHDQSRELNTAEIRGHCSKHVPRYMIPEEIEFRAGLPKTSTGKTDKKALLGPLK